MIPDHNSVTAKAPGSRWYSSTALHLIAVFIVAVWAHLQYQIDEQPILIDRAYMLYMAQVVYQGDALYSTTTFGYPPYGPMLSALAMHGGRVFGLESYLAPRYASLVVAALNACLLYLLAFNVTRKRSLSLLAGLSLSGFGAMGILVVSSLEAKLLLTSCMLLAGYSLLRQRWLLSGATSAAAMMFWQPAGIIIAAIAIALWFHKDTSRRQRCTRFALGLILGLLPAILYLSILQQWDSFYYQAIIRKALTNLPGAGQAPLSWLGDVITIYQTETLVFAAAFAGFAWFGLRMAKHSPKERQETLFRDGYAVFALLTLAWALFNTIEFDGGPDLLPMLPLFAFWCAYFVHSGMTVISKTALCERVPALKRIAPAVAIFLLTVYLFADSISYRPAYTLAEQRQTVNAHLDEIGARADFVAFNAEEYYVLSESRSPLRYTQLGKWVDRIIDHYEPGGIDGFLVSLHKNLPPTVIIRTKKQSAVQDSIEQYLADYTTENIAIPGRHRSYTVYRKP